MLGTGVPHTPACFLDAPHTSSLPRRAAQEDGDYAHAFWLCVRCGQAMSGASALRCAQPLADRVNALYEETIDRLELALQACCKDFKPDTLCKVCECSGLMPLPVACALLSGRGQIRPSWSRGEQPALS